MACFTFNEFLLLVMLADVPVAELTALPIVIQRSDAIVTYDLVGEKICRVNVQRKS